MAETKGPPFQKEACLRFAGSPSPAGSENGPGAVAAAIVPTAYLYNLSHFHTFVFAAAPDRREGSKSQV
jgi:hypothetical protein